MICKMFKVWDKVRMNKECLLRTCRAEEFEKYYKEWTHYITKLSSLVGYRYYLSCFENVRYSEEEIIPVLTYDL